MNSAALGTTVPPVSSESAKSTNAHINRAFEQNVQNIEPRADYRPINRDTVAWRAQVWISFAIATFLCGVGLAYLPGLALDRAFMVMGYFFCLSSAFVLSKFVRDKQAKKADTPHYGYVVYVAFAAALGLTAWGLYRMDIADSYKAYLLVSWLYLITTTFTLAKSLRDAHEYALFDAREAAKAELRAEVARERSR